MTRDHPHRLQSLRAALAEQGLDGFLLPLTDAYQGEYSAACDRRVTWLTGFDGSAGMVLVCKDRAALFVDGRYTLQAAQQVDAADYAILNSGETSPMAYAREALPNGGVLGYDPWLHTSAQIERWRAEGEKPALRPLAMNPVDAIWTDRPPPPCAPVEIHPPEFAGVTREEKLAAFAVELVRQDVDAFVVSLPENLCWLLNIRGGDIPFNPLPQARAIVTATAEATLFIDPRKLNAEVRDALEPHVAWGTPEEFSEALAWNGNRVGYDPDRSPQAIERALKEAGVEIRRMPDPCMLPKAIKNDAEILGMKRAHVIDGVAVTRFLHWYDTLPPEVFPWELEIVDRLESFRRRAPEYRGPSFDTIAGVAGNGAIIHYRPTEATNRRAGPNDILLLDSGAQYPFGTTDITRTLCRGAPSPEFREAYTAVLKGHIALAQARFPEGTTGSQLDILARQPLWNLGLDYDHGTGHGVGAYLCVHEGPARIAKRGGDVPLQAGMILSNEPGYYKAGEYGIRIENLILVVERGQAANGKKMLGFETLTLAPIDLRLAETKSLDAAERAWLNTYHTRVTQTLSPSLGASERDWLQRHAAML